MTFIDPVFDIRWRLDYFNDVATKRGFWTREAERIEDMAAFKQTNGLARALIELKDKRTGVTTTPVHCAGPDFCLFKWGRIAKMGKGKISGQLVSLTLVTREFDATVYIDGKIKITARTSEDKGFHYEGFGK